MGYSDSTAFTVKGVKNIYYSLLFAIPFCIVIFLCATFFYTPGFIASFVVGVFFTLIFFIIGIGDMINGREEISEKHSTNVIYAAVFSSISVILFLFVIILFLIESSILLSFEWISDPLPLIIASILITAMLIAFMVFLGLGLMLFVLDIISENKKFYLFISFAMLIAFPIVSILIVNLNILYCLVSAIVFILPLVLFLICYKSVLVKLKASELKAVPLIPCPFCDHVIPVHSNSCRHCGAKFEKELEEEIDPRLNMDKPKPQYTSPHGYTPVEGPSVKQKKLVKIFFTIAIVLIIVAGSLFFIFSKSDTERFIGTWRLDSSVELAPAYNQELGTIQWALYRNGSMKFSHIDKNGTENVSTISWGQWGVKDGKLYSFDPKTQTGSLYETQGVEYRFFNNDESFEVDFVVLGTTFKATFNKVS